MLHSWLVEHDSILAESASLPTPLKPHASSLAQSLTCPSQAESQGAQVQAVGSGAEGGWEGRQHNPHDQEQAQDAGHGASRRQSHTDHAHRDARHQGEDEDAGAGGGGGSRQYGREGNSGGDGGLAKAGSGVGTAAAASAAEGPAADGAVALSHARGSLADAEREGAAGPDAGAGSEPGASAGAGRAACTRSAQESVHPAHTAHAGLMVLAQHAAMGAALPGLGARAAQGLVYGVLVGGQYGQQRSKL